MKLLDKEILYLDNHIIVINKKRLLLTQPTNLELDSVETRVKVWLKNKYNKPGKVFAHPVHRLDRVASGIVVCARSSKALSRLNEQIRLGEWVKKYTLMHEGLLPNDDGKLLHYMMREEYRSKICRQGDVGAKEAKLYYKNIGNRLVQVMLITGRYHQIRVQFAEIGCPILNDIKYGASKIRRDDGIALQHTSLQFTHPTTKELLKFNVEIDI